MARSMPGREATTPAPYAALHSLFPRLPDLRLHRSGLDGGKIQFALLLAAEGVLVTIHTGEQM